MNQVDGLKLYMNLAIWGFALLGTIILVAWMNYKPHIIERPVGYGPAAAAIVCYLGSIGFGIARFFFFESVLKRTILIEDASQHTMWELEHPNHQESTNIMSTIHSDKVVLTGVELGRLLAIHYSEKYGEKIQPHQLTWRAASTEVYALDVTIGHLEEKDEK